MCALSLIAYCIPPFDRHGTECVSLLVGFRCVSVRFTNSVSIRCCWTVANVYTRVCECAIGTVMCLYRFFFPQSTVNVWMVCIEFFELLGYTRTLTHSHRIDECGACVFYTLDLQIWNHQHTSADRNVKWAKRLCFCMSADDFGFLSGSNHSSHYVYAPQWQFHTNTPTHWHHHHQHHRIAHTCAWMRVLWNVKRLRFTNYFFLSMSIETCTQPNVTYICFYSLSSYPIHTF